MARSTKMGQTGAVSSEGQQAIGDAAVDGLLAGAGAGIAMAAYLVLAGLAAGAGPLSVLARFDPGTQGSPLIGALVHLALSAVYGLLFGAFYRLLGRGRWGGRVAGAMIGLAYGMLLLLVAQGLTLAGAATALREIPAVHLALAHLVYGVVLGWLVAQAK